MNWYLKVLRQYADFKGRARRKEFWIFMLISGIISWITVAIDYALGTNIDGSTIGVINIIYILVVMIPALAVAVRRLHDIGKSGWMYLIILIPIVGPIWLIVLWATDSNPGENQYGANPKETAV